MEDSNKPDENKQEKKISVALKEGTIELLDEVAKKKVHKAMESGSLNIIDLIRNKRGRGISYDSQINFLARVYLAVMDETILTKDIVERNPELKKVMDRLNEINHFFTKYAEQEDEESV